MRGILAWLRQKKLRNREAGRVERLRALGVQIGQGCRIYTEHFSTNPYLVSIGDGVVVAGGAKFLTHNGAARMLKHRRPKIQSFGRIVVGNDTFIGENALILGGVTIGKGCIIGAGAVVRGKIPDDSLVVGNPAQVVGQASAFLEQLLGRPGTVDTFGLTEPERRKILFDHFGLNGSR